MDDKFIFPFPSTKTAIFMDGKRKSKVTYQGQLNCVKADRIRI